MVVALVRPLSWGLGLVAFLAGGGALVMALPVLALPTMTGWQNALGGPLTSLVFGIPAGPLLLLVTGAVAGVLALLVAAVTVGAWAERRGIAVALAAAADEALIATAPVPETRLPGLGAVVELRLAALLPVLAVAAVSAQRVYEVIYHELILPDDLASPLALRVVAAVPAQLGALVLAWLLADAAAAVAVRRLVVDGVSAGRAWLAGWGELLRHPVRVVGAALAGLVVTVLLVGPALVASAVGWSRVRDILLVEAPAPVALAAVLVWVAIWLGALVLAAVAAAVRASAFTLVALRVEAQAAAPNPVHSADPAGPVPSPGAGGEGEAPALSEVVATPVTPDAPALSVTPDAPDAPVTTPA